MLSHLGITDDDIQDILNIHPEETETFDIDDSTLDVPFNLSTMTICGELGGTINIPNILHNLPIQPYWKSHNGILRVEGYHNGEIYFRGISRKYIEKRNTGTGPFRNCATLYCRIFDEEYGDAKEPCVKLFRNGGFQITGIRTPVQANEIVSFVKSTLDDTMFTPVNDGFTIVCMMNSDITLPYRIKREALQEIIRRENIRSTFESTTYQGVNIKYYWNYDKYEHGECQTGICECTEVCASSGKKRIMKDPSKNKPSGCVRITIAPFQTGKIIITGAKTIEQIKDASQWILEIIQKHKHEILLPKLEKVSKKKIKIPFRSGIIFKI